MSAPSPRSQPTRLAALTWLGAALLAGSNTLGAAAPGPSHVFHRENVLGTSLELKVIGTSASEASAVESVVLSEIDRLARILSSYDPGSEFSRWFSTSNTAQPVSPELFTTLSLFDDWRVQTGGALDAAAEAACRLWKSAATRQSVPREDELLAAVASIQQPHWRLDSEHQTATHLDTTPLVLNSFVKGLILGRAAEAGLASGSTPPTALVLNIGGDLVVRGDWMEPVRIANPSADAENDEPLTRLRLRNCAVATSGGYRRGYQIGDQWYSHIVDPRTARPAGHILGATVLGPDPVTAGALATAACVLAPAESLRLVAEHPGYECLLVDARKQCLTSPRWKDWEATQLLVAAAGNTAPLGAAPPAPTSPSPSPAGSAAPAGTPTWDPAYELTVHFELNHIEDRGYRRPFVAIWIEDKDKFPVRTLSLWFDKPRWLPDLRSWYRADQLRALADGSDLTASISSATRPAGRYSVKWDGKDDHGKPVPPGRYTVFIEAAREHGSYQLIRQDIDCRPGPNRFALKGNSEVASAALEYRRKP